MSTPDAQHAAALIAEALDVLVDADGLEETIRTRDPGGEIHVGGLPITTTEATALVRDQRGAALMSLASSAAINLQRIADALEAGAARPETSITMIDDRTLAAEMLRRFDERATGDGG